MSKKKRTFIFGNLAYCDQNPTSCRARAALHRELPETDIGEPPILLRNEAVLEGSLTLLAMFIQDMGDANRMLLLSAYISAEGSSASACSGYT